MPDYIKDRAKHEMRIRDIRTKAGTDEDKAQRLAATQAKLITHPQKAWDRGLVAQEKHEPIVAEIFFHQYKRLTQTRDDKLSIILESFFNEEGTTPTT